MNQIGAARLNKWITLDDGDYRMFELESINSGLLKNSRLIIVESEKLMMGK